MDAPAPHHSDLSIIRPAELWRMLSVSPATGWRWARLGLLPPKVQLGPGAVGWRRRDVEAWLSERTEVSS